MRTDSTGRVCQLCLAVTVGVLWPVVDCRLVTGASVSVTVLIFDRAPFVAPCVAPCVAARAPINCLWHAT